MTFRMLDSIYPANLPAGAEAYLGYRDGSWPDFRAEVARFPGAHILDLAVFASDDATGLDIENGDATIADVYDWFTRQQVRKVWRPVLYISASRAQSLLDTMDANGFARTSWRLLTAHYGAGEHICRPGTCGYPQADGTQWTDSAPGVGGSFIDESLLLDSFFPAPKPPSPPPLPREDDMAMLATGAQAQTVIRFAKGAAKGLALANDATLLSQPGPVVRVAAHSAAGHFRVATLTLTASGTDEVKFTDPDVDFVSVSRVSGDAGDDVAVGWCLL